MPQIGMDGTSITTNIKDNFPSPPSQFVPPASYAAGPELMLIPCDLLICGTDNTTAAETHFGSNYVCFDGCKAYRKQSSILNHVKCLKCLLQLLPTLPSDVEKLLVLYVDR